MLASKTKSSSECLNHKTTPATHKVSKVVRNGSTKSESGSPSPVPPKQSTPLPKSRGSVERSPKSVESKPTKRLSAAPDLKTAKEAELKAKFDVFEEDLKKTREQLAAMEQEKVQTLDALKEAKHLVDETDEKLQHAIAAKKQAEDELEIEKFRADELEQAGIEAVKKCEEKHQEELESLKTQYDQDVSALHSMSEELRKLKFELARKSEAKNAAESEADGAKKLAEVNGEKVDFLSNEVIRLKSLLDSKLDNVNKEAAEMIKKLNTEVDDLKMELERAKAAEEKLAEVSVLFEKLQFEVQNVKKAELDACNLVDEWKMKAASLEISLEEANQSVRSTSASLAATMKTLEQNNSLLYDAKTEVTTLKGKIGSLEIEVAKYRSDLEESQTQTDLAQQELISLGTTIEMLKSELQRTEEETMQVVEREKLAASNVQNLTLEKNKLHNELKNSREELEKAKKSMEALTSALHENKKEAASNMQRLMEEKNKLNDELKTCREELENVKKATEALTLELHENEKVAASNIQSLTDNKNKLNDELKASREELGSAKKAMDGLASALHEMSTEARDNQERLLIKQAEIEKAHLQIEQLSSSLKNTEERFQVMLDEARYEIVCLQKTVEKFENDASNSSTEWEAKELNFVNAIRRSEDEIASAKAEIAKVVESLKEAEQEVEAAKADGAEMLSKLKQAESGAMAAHDLVEAAKAESLGLKERLLDKENELQNITQENVDLRSSEAAGKQKIAELSVLLAEAMAKNKANSESPNGEKEHKQSPRASELPEKKTKIENHAKDDKKLEKENKEGTQNADDEEDCLAFLEKDLKSERDQTESTDDDTDSKLDYSMFEQINGEAENVENGTNAHNKLNKRKPLLHKFGNLLKKKGNRRN